LEAKEYLKAILSVGKRFPMIAVGGTIGTILVSWHYNGAGRDPNDITLYVGLASFVLSILGQIIDHARQSYRPNTVQCLNQDVALGAAEHVLRKNITKELFQLLSVRSDNGVMDVFATSESGGSTFTCRHDVYALMKKTADDCTSSLLTVLYPGQSSGSANVLRLVYDIHPGGAFFFGDLNVPNRKLNVFGYTNRQNNVNECSDSMGKIIDNLRRIEAFGGLPPITKINDDD
jgi:hypothetical protein